MSRDIRSFFTKVNGNSKNDPPKQPEPKGGGKKKRKVIESDSEDDDLIFVKHTSKKQKESNSSSKTETKKEKEKEKKKEVILPVDLEKVFGKAPVQQKAQTIKHSEKPKEEKNEEPKKSKSKRDKEKKKDQKKEEKPAAATATDSFFEDDFEASFSQIDEEQLEQLGLSSTSTTPNKKTPPKQVPTNRKSPRKEEKKTTPIKETVVSEKKTTAANKNKKDEDNFKTPDREKLKTPSDKGKDSLPNSDQKKKNAEFYQRYLQRSGPKNPGSKKIPKGTPDCLKGKAFVITGVLDSMEREEAQELIQKCGGRVTSAVSKKTDYIVVGEDAGVSKLDKAQKFGTKHLTEDELLDLIRAKSGEDISDSSEEIIEETPPMVESEYFKSDKKRAKQDDEKSKKRVKQDDENKKQSKQDDEEKSKKRMKEDDKEKNKRQAKPDDEKAKKLEITPKGKGISEKKFYGDSPSSGVGTMSSSQESYSSQEELAPDINLGDTLWVEKYKPKTTKQIIGQNGERSNVKKLIKWLQDWQKNHSGTGKKFTKPAPWSQTDDGRAFKAALLSGSPGVGKTTTVQLVCKELGLDIIEFNASDTRSKRLLQEDVSELLSTKTIKGFLNKEPSTKHVLVMDEVDGMAGNEDRGGIQELIQLIKNSKVPVICMCNDRNHPKMRSLVNYCFDLRFNRPRIEQIKAAMMSVCFKEGIKITGDALGDIIVGSNQDVRQVLHNLSMWAVKNKNLSAEQVKVDAAMARKPLNMGPWDVARKVFSASEHGNMSLRDKEELFFQDYSLGPLFVQDLYLKVKPKKANNDKKTMLDLVSKAADSIMLGDIVERTIRSQNSWNLLPVQAIFSSVLPGHHMEGYVSGQIQFPAWLGKNSKRNKFDRLLQELQVHMRLSITGSKEAVNLDYLTYIRDAILKPLIDKGADGVQEAVQVMVDYHLTREDLDSILELTQWPNSKDLFGKIDSKVKAAFTRAYNKEGKAPPYATNLNIRKVAVSAEAEYGEEIEGVEAEAEDDDKVDTDVMIKKGKPKKVEKKQEKKTEKKSEKKSDESTSKGKKGRTSKKGKS